MTSQHAWRASKTFENVNDFQKFATFAVFRKKNIPFAKLLNQWYSTS